MNLFGAPHRPTESVGGRHSIVLAASLAAAGVVFAIVYSRLGVHIGHDQAFFLDLANSLALGRGLVVNNFYPYLVPGGTVPMTDWPPGYPFLASIFIRVMGLDAPTAGFVVGLLSYALVIVFTTWIAMRCGGKLVALVAGLFVAINPELWVAATRIMSEAPFIAALLAFVIYMDYRSGKTGLPQVLAAGALCAAAVYFRYAGYAIVVALAMLFLLSRERSERRFLVNVGIAFLAILAPLLIRNQLVIGDARGNIRPPTDVTFFQNLYMSGFGILEQLLPERFVDVLLSSTGSVAGPAIGLAVALTFLTLLLRGTMELRDSTRRAYGLLAVVTLAYFLFYVVVRTFLAYDLLTEERLWWPVVPFIAVWFGRLVESVRRGGNRYLIVPVAASVGVYVLLSATYLLLGPHRKGEFAVDEAVVWIQRNVPKGACLVSEDGKEGFRLRPYLPHHRFVFTPDDAFQDRSVDVAAYLMEYAAQTGCHYAVSLPAYVNRFDDATSYANSSFHWSASYLEMLTEDHSGNASVLVAEPAVSVVLFQPVEEPSESPDLASG